MKSDLNDNVPKLIMNQLRWMDNIVDPNQLTESLFEMISITPIHIQKEIIEAIPDIIIDSQHNTVVRKLKEIMEDDTELVVPILDTLSNLKFTESLMDELKDTVIKHLENCELEKIPILIKFLLQSIENNDKAKTMITKIRIKLNFNAISSLLKVEDAMNDNNKTQLNISKSFGKLLFECFKNELRAKPCLCEEWLKLINEFTKKEDFKSLDIDILYIIHSININYKKRVETIIKKKIKENLITPELIGDSIVLHKSGIVDYCSSIITISELLLNDNTANSNQLALSIYYNSFASFDTYYRQEIIGSLVTHIGTGLNNAVECSLNILRNIVNSFPTEVIQFIVFIKNILDYLDNLNINQIRILFDILSTLAVKSKDSEVLNNSGESSLYTDLNIIIRKQLSNPMYRYKIMGIIMGLSLICKLSPKKDNTKMNEHVKRNNMKLSCSLLRMMEIQCRKSLACLQYIYDELSYLISNDCICKELQEWIQDNFACNFQNIFLLDVEDLNRVISKEFYYDDEIINDEEEVTGKGKQTVNNSLKFSSWNNLDGEESTIVLKILPILLNTSNSQMATESNAIIICMCSMFRLLQACEKSLNDNNLDSIDALLGCGVLLYEESKDDYSNELKYQLCNGLFYSINWYRELLNSFCDQDDNEMKEKCIIRLKNIIDMEKKLGDLLSSMNNIKYSPIGLYETILINEINNNNENYYLEEENLHSHDKKGFSNIKDLKPYMREIDISLFEILKFDLLYIEKNDISDEQKLINYSIFKYILTELNEKIKQKIELNRYSNISNNNKKSNKDVTNTNSLIQRISMKKFLLAIAQIIPYLCKYLEDLKMLIDDAKNSQNVEQEELCNECFYIILENLNYVFSSKDLREEEYSDIKNNILLGIMKLMGDSNASQEEDQKIMKIFKYFVNFKNKIESPHSYIMYIKLLDSILTLFPSTIENNKIQHLNNIVVDIIKSTMKKKLSIKSSEKNESIVYLLHLCIKKSNNPLEILKYYCIDILPLFIDVLLSPESDVPNELLDNPQLNNETFDTYYKIMLVELNDFLQSVIQLSHKNMNSTFKILYVIVDCFTHLTQIVKIYDKKAILKHLLKQGKVFLDTFVKKAMPVLNSQFRFFRDDIISTLKILQQSTRIFQSLCNDSKIMKDLVLTSNVPQAKKILEALLFEVKIMLDDNKCLQAFWIGNLRHRNIAGNFVSSQFIQEPKELKEVKSNIDDIDSALNNNEDDNDIDKLLGSDEESKENQNSQNKIKKEIKTNKKGNKNKNNKNNKKGNKNNKKNQITKSEEIVNDDDDDDDDDDNNDDDNDNDMNISENDSVDMNSDTENNNLKCIIKIEAPENVIPSSQLHSSNHSSRNQNLNNENSSTSQKSNKSKSSGNNSNLKNSGEIINNRSLEMEISPIKPIIKKKKRRIISDDEDDDNEIEEIKDIDDINEIDENDNEEVIKTPKKKRQKREKNKNNKSKRSIYLLSQASIDDDSDRDEIEEDLDNYDVNDSFINDDTIMYD
ncbi:hypothetical protein BCR32DRAFT_290760 [Anaeromyces robustus]|uniref:Fanconi anemia group D2 protein n=1 Tax=Anaeromyces robustus TaxID=1754192 RepID=A0A1Y1XHV4_9FUNG|nr:hypothetical protein BCR32DRAFT_290760 [Anaeromyces robustus]|eukprot:ORX85340.1 hypothetical protein BCR32DRAFT_290760 [Anaeromyces robustus]